MGGIGLRARVARPLVRDVGVVALGQDLARGVDQDLLDLVRRQAPRVGIGRVIDRVQRGGLDHSEERRLEGGGTGGSRLAAREDRVGAVAGHVRPAAEGLGILAFDVLHQAVAGVDVVKEVAVGVIHGVEVIRVHRHQDSLLLHGVLDRFPKGAGVGVGNDDRGHRVNSKVGRVGDRRRQTVGLADRLGPGLDRNHSAVAAVADPGEVVVRLAAHFSDQARGVAVGPVLGLRIVGVVVGVPAGDVIRIAVAVVVELAVARAGAEPVIDDLAVAEDVDQVFGREVPGQRAADVDLVDVLMGAAGGAAPGGSLFVNRELGGGLGTCRVDPRILRVVADVELTVAVEVVTTEVLAIPALRIGKLGLVQIDRVEPILDSVGAVVDAALDVGDQDVITADVALGPGSGHVDTG